MSLVPGDVVQVLRRVLDAIENAADKAEHELPDRRYITTGGAVYDCEQVTVSANRIQTGVAGDDAAGGPVANCGPGWNVELELAIVRKSRELPQGRRGQAAPTTEMIESDTADADKDAAALTGAVEELAGPGWDQFGRVPASILFGEVQGGLSGVVLTVTLNLWIPEVQP